MEEPEEAPFFKPRRRHPSWANVLASNKASLTIGLSSSVRSDSTTGGVTGAGADSSASKLATAEVDACDLGSGTASEAALVEDNKGEDGDKGAAGDELMAAHSPTT